MYNVGMFTPTFKSSQFYADCIRALGDQPTIKESWYPSIMAAAVIWIGISWPYDMIRKLFKKR